MFWWNISVLISTNGGHRSKTIVEIRSDADVRYYWLVKRIRDGGNGRVQNWRSCAMAPALRMSPLRCSRVFDHDGNKFMNA